MAAEADNFFSRWSRRKLQVHEQAPATAVRPEDEPPAARHVARGQAADNQGLAGAQAIAQPNAQEPLQPAAVSADTSAAEVARPPTMDDLALLDHDSSYARFVARDVSPDVRNAAMKKLFADPHYNVMDGLDIYIDDYGKPDPLPAGMLRQMVQSRMLGLFAAEDAADEAAEAAAAAAAQNELAAPALPSEQSTHTGVGDNDTEFSLPVEAVTLATAPDEDTHLQLQPVDDAGCAGADPGTGQDAWRQHGRAG